MTFNVPDGLRATAISAYWEGFSACVRLASIQARDLELSLLLKQAAPPDQPAAVPAPNGADKPNGAAHSGAPA